MKIDLFCEKCSPWTIVSGNTSIMRMFVRVSCRLVSGDSEWSQIVIFSALDHLMSLDPSEIRPTLLYVVPHYL